MSKGQVRGIRYFAAVAASILALGALAGCTAGSGSSTPASGEISRQSDSKGVLDGGGNPASVPAPDRKVISTGDVSLTVKSPTEAAVKVADIAVGAGGRVDSRQEVPGTATEPGRADLVIRVPADKFEATVQTLKQVGTVVTLSTQQTDVTQQSIDLGARVKALQTAVDRLNALLAKASTTADLITIEGELSKRQAELDSLVQQRDALANQVDLATLSVHLFSPKLAPPSPGPTDFWSGLVAGWNALLTFVGGVVIGFGVAVPWLVVLALLAAVVWWIVRARARRARAQRAAAWPAPNEAGSPTAAAEASDAPMPPAD